MSSNIADFRAKFKGGTRPNRFRVTGNIPGSGDISDQSFLVKAASMPAATMGEIVIPYRGRGLRIPGDRIFEPWTFTMLDDNPSLREKLITWGDKINSHVENLTKDPSQNDDQVQWTVEMVEHMGTKADSPIRTVTLHNCWPLSISPIDLSMDVADSLSEFSCTLAYDFWTGSGAKGVEGEEDGGFDPGPMA
tara:strand:+ start:10951 stop:11526 length:576 start_codon:yes stop_codon:yes gene_type:complete